MSQTNVAVISVLRVTVTVPPHGITQNRHLITVLEDSKGPALCVLQVQPVGQKAQAAFVAAVTAAGWADAAADPAASRAGIQFKSPTPKVFVDELVAHLITGLGRQIGMDFSFHLSSNDL